MFLTIMLQNKFLFLCSKVSYTDDGLEAIIFTAQGDMRQALNNLQSTFKGIISIFTSLLLNKCLFVSNCTECCQ